MDVWYYSAEFKMNLVKKVTVPPTRSATSLSKEEGIPQSTLSRWFREAAITGGKGEGMAERRHEQWSGEEELEMLEGMKIRPFAGGNKNHRVSGSLRWKGS